MNRRSFLLGSTAFAWPMIDVEKWAAPVPASGARKFWEWLAP